MKKDSPLVSVIVPTFNAEQHIRQCLDSLQSQTLKDVEFLCIDDGSKDASLNVLEEYAAKDNRFKVMHQENQGAAVARNAGLELASGDWIAFMDPDDFYPSDDTLQVMYESAVRNNVAICGGSVLTINQTGEVQEGNYEGEMAGYQFKKDGILSYADYQFDYGFWRFLYKRELIEKHHLRFPLLRRFQDPPFMVRAFSLAGSFYALKRPTYTYRDGNGWAKMKWEEDNYIKARHMLQGMSEVCSVAESQNLEKLRLRRLLNLFEGAGEVFQRASVLEAIKEEYISVIQRHAPLVTVVVPVYNDEKYVVECLDSILSQTYMHIEIICVNDGSTDNSLSVLEQYAAEKSNAFFNIKIVSQENGGLSAARNAGMDHATGKYIYFLDSDDKLNQTYAILRMVLFAEEHQLDQIIFTCELFSEEQSPELQSVMEKKYEYLSVYAPLNYWILPGMELFSQLEKNGKFFATQQMRFYRLQSLTDHNLRYPDGLLHEDNYMAPASLRFAKKAVIIDERFLARRIHVNSITINTGDKSKRLLGLWGVVRLLCEDKRLWDAPENFTEMLKKFIHERLWEMYWLAKDSHAEEAFAPKMFVLSCCGDIPRLETDDTEEEQEEEETFFTKVRHLFRKQ